MTISIHWRGGGGLLACDTILIFGFWALGVRYMEVLDFFLRSEATTMIVDDWVDPDTSSSLRLISGDTDPYPKLGIPHAFKIFSIPTAGFVATLLDLYRLRVTSRFDWQAVLGTPTEEELSLYAAEGLSALGAFPVLDYKVGCRSTFRVEKTALTPRPTS